MKPFRLGVLGVALLLAACTSSSPTPTSLDPAGPSYDGGASLGSGNYQQGDGGGNTSGSGNNEGSSTPPDTTTTERGGNGLGSGN